MGSQGNSTRTKAEGIAREAVKGKQKLGHLIEVIPILVDDVGMPKGNQLPRELWPLAGLNALHIGALSFRIDIDILIKRIESILKISKHFDPLIATSVNSQGQVIVNRNSKNFRGFTIDVGNGVTIDMIRIQGGPFCMGSLKTDRQARDNEYPRHSVEIPDFYMSRYTITQAQWRQVAVMRKVKDDLEIEPAQFKGDENLPVENVSWYDAVEFCKRLSNYTRGNYRLPSESEWEYACRAKTETTFSFGDVITTNVANYDGSPFAANHDSLLVERNTPGKRRAETIPTNEFDFSNPFGLCQMHGNVDEWCQDTYHKNYSGAPSDGSAWETEQSESDHRGPERILRGGSWVCGPWWCRSTSRLKDYPGKRLNNVGFRIVYSTPVDL